MKSGGAQETPRLFGISSLQVGAPPGGVFAGITIEIFARNIIQNNLT